MFVYEKRLQYPIHVKNTNPRLASLIISQYGGPNPNKLQPRPDRPQSGRGFPILTSPPPGYKIPHFY